MDKNVVRYVTTAKPRNLKYKAKLRARKKAQTQIIRPAFIRVEKNV
ncbi:MAG: hypothetical protein WA631_02080 [Nitrososphaeraceae archaeon]